MLDYGGSMGYHRMILCLRRDCKLGLMLRLWGKLVYDAEILEFA